MPAIAAHPLPDTSLLARHRGPECYRDAYAAHIPQAIGLDQLVTAFYSSNAFLPERLALSIIGRGANKNDIAALAKAETRDFAAWSVEAREDDQILLRDFRDATCSWLRAEAVADGTMLWFGTGLRKPDRPVIRALMPFHRWYAKRLLTSAVKALAQ